MELGSLPEWFTAFAEVTAVCVALFLPQYTAYRDRKASLARMRRVVSGMLDALATDRAHCAAGCDPRAAGKRPGPGSCACRSSC